MKTRLDETNRMRKLMGLSLITEQEEIVTDYDNAWDYKKVEGDYYTKKKTSDKWIKTKPGTKPYEAIKTKVFKDTDSQTVPFKNAEEGNAFRQWVNDNHPEEAKSMNLDPQGSYNNSYINKAYVEFGDDYTDSTSEIEDDDTTDDSETGCIEGDCENGQGSYTYVSGDKYVGEFKDGWRNGQGTYVWKEDGAKYVGEWLDSVQVTGKGTYIYADGSTVDN